MGTDPGDDAAVEHGNRQAGTPKLDSRMHALWNASTVGTALTCRRQSLSSMVILMSTSPSLSVSPDRVAWCGRLRRT